MSLECIIPSPSRWFSKQGLRLSFKKKKSPNKVDGYSLSSSPSPISSPSSSVSSKSGRTKEEELKNVFHHFDINKDEKISALELLRYFAFIGETVSLEGTQEVIHEFDSDNDGMLDFHDFVKLMDTKDGVEEELVNVFEMFEYEKGLGRITPRGLQRAFNRLGESKTYQECVAMIQFYDVDGNGELGFNEFHQMMTM